MSKPIATKRFAGGYVAEITPNIDREGVDCHVTKGNYQASLSLIENEGVMWWNGPGSKEDINVPDKTADAISEWAQDHGY